MKNVQRMLALTLLPSLVLLSSCGGNDNSLGPAGGAAAVGFADGTWRVTTTMTVLGQATECQGQDPIVVEQDQILCAATAEEITGVQDFSTGNFTCDLDSNGNSYTIDCSGSFFQDPCTIGYSISGQGSNTETSFSIVMDYAISASGPLEECGVFDQPCTTRMELSGVWVSSDGGCGTGSLGHESTLRELISETIENAVVAVR